MSANNETIDKNDIIVKLYKDNMKLMSSFEKLQQENHLLKEEIIKLIDENKKLKDWGDNIIYCISSHNEIEYLQERWKLIKIDDDDGSCVADYSHLEWVDKEIDEIKNKNKK